MSKARKKPATLAVFFFCCTASAAAAFFARAPVAKMLKPYAGKTLPVSHETLSYATVFALSFAALALIQKLRGLRITEGFAPRTARVFLAAFVFAVPLMALKIGAAEKRASLDVLFAPPQKKPEKGYAEKDRAKLDALMEKTHETP